MDNRILEDAELAGSDPDEIAVLQSERRLRYEAGARGEDRPVGVDVGLEEVCGKLVEAPMELPGTCLSPPGSLSVSFDLQRDGQCVGVTDFPDGAYCRPKCACTKVALCLKKIERVCPFDRAREDIIADGEANNLRVAVEDERDLRFRYVEIGVLPHCDRFVVASHPPARRLEEQFWTLGVVDELVDVRGGLDFLDPRLPRRFVRHSGGPDLHPAVERGEQVDLVCRDLCQAI